jgi:hypothetical protein
MRYLNSVGLFSCCVLSLASTLHAQADKAAAIPKDTQISIRTVDAIQSRQVEVGQSYRCSMEAPVLVAGKEIVPKGADCVLRIVEMKSAGKLTGSNELKLVVSEIRVDGALVTVTSEPTAIAGAGKGKGTAVRSGVGAIGGGAIGGIFGGKKGAVIGGAAGAAAGAASSALTQGPEIKVASETILSFTIQ